MRSLKQHVYQVAPDLYRRVWHHAVEELKLPYLVDFSIIGFGKYTDFYMFWLSQRDGVIYFNARRRFHSARGENMVRMPFAPENEQQMMEAMDAIYANYQAGEEAWGCDDLVSSKTSDISFLGDDIRRLDEALEVLKAHIKQTGDREIIRPRVGTRAYHVLQENGITTDSQLVAFGATRLAGCKNCGRETLKKLTEFVLRRTSFEHAPDDLPLHLQHAEIWRNIEDKLKSALKTDAQFTAQESGETIGVYEELGVRFVTVAEALLDGIVASSAHAKKSLAMLREYTSSDAMTLATVASASGISREGARQRIQKGKARCATLFRDHLKTKSKVFHEHLSTLIEVFDAVGCDNIIPFAYYGLGNISHRRRETIFSILFSSAIGERMTKEVKRFATVAQAEEAARAQSQDLSGHWAFFASKIIFPAKVSVAPSAPVSSCEKFMEYDYERQLAEKLARFAPVVQLIESPDLVYTTETDAYRPDFLLVLPDGRQVLVVVAPTLSLALYFNVCRLNALHLFCKTHGYGYLILDDHDRSIFELRYTPLDPLLKEELNTLLNTHGVIVWEDIQALRTRFSISDEELVAYVLGEKLRFSIDPFRITTRQ